MPAKTDIISGRMKESHRTPKKGCKIAIHKEKNFGFEF